MDRTGEGRSVDVPVWFWIAAGLALLWKLMGCFAFYTQKTTPLASMPLDQRSLWAAMPGWSMAAYAIAVSVGLIGTIMLLMRRRIAVTLELVSLLAVIVQFSALMIVPEIRGMISSDKLLMPIIIIVICYAIWNLARLALRRGWLR